VTYLTTQATRIISEYVYAEITDDRQADHAVDLATESHALAPRTTRAHTNGVVRIQEHAAARSLPEEFDPWVCDLWNATRDDAVDQYLDTTQATV
jgi:hypothetical protein